MTLSSSPTLTRRGNTAPSFTYTDPKPSRLRNGSIIHLHGAIRWATEENILSQLILNEESYVRQHFEKTAWYEELERDRRFCHAFFFVGYSLSDYHISALLLQDPTSRDKTYFINGPKPDSVFLNRIAKYGRPLRINAQGFTELCRNLPPPDSAQDLHKLKAFRYLDPFLDKKTLTPPTPVEILNLVTYGTFSYHRFLSAASSSSYVAPRQQSVDDAIQRLERASSLLVHSHLGNGKSIFQYSLAYRLSQNGYSCLICRPNAIFAPRDLDALRNASKVALFFDSHHSAIDLIDGLRSLPPETKFIIAVRSSTLELRRHVFENKFALPLEDVSLDRISGEDKAILRNILDRSGVRVVDLEHVIRSSNNFREIVATLYDNTQILMRSREELAIAEKFIVTAYARAKENPTFRTYQIDTYALMLFMLIEQEANASERVARFAQIMDRLERVRSMIGDENHVLHAVSAVAGVEGFVTKRLGALSTPERQTLGNGLRAVCEELDKLSNYDRERTDSDGVRASIDRATELLVG